MIWIGLVLCAVAVGVYAHGVAQIRRVARDLRR